MTMQRAFSVLECKQFDEEQRVIHGLATSPVPDRAGDIVDQYGASHAKTIPLFLYHDSRLTVGTVELGKPTKEGIPFKATLPKIAEPGALQDRVNEAWQLVKYKLIAAVSIGFRAIEGKVELLKTGGLKFLESEILELSLVPVPMQSLATIHTLRSFDAEVRKALGITATPSIETSLRAATGSKTQGDDEDRERLLAPPPGASGIKKQPASGGFFYARSKGKEMKTYAEQITDLVNKRAEHIARMDAVMKAGPTEGRTTDGEEGDEFDTLATEVKRFDSDLERLRLLEKLNVEKAPTMTISGTGGGAVTKLPVSVKNTQKLEPGIALARYARCLLLAEGSKHGAAQIAKNQYPEMDWMVGMLEAETGGLKKEAMFMQKAAVAGGNTTDSTWAAPLVQYQQYAGDFIEYLRPQMIIGKFGTGGIPALRRVPFNVTVSGQTSGASAGWVGEAAPKPVTKAGFANVNLRWAKIAGITVISEELARMSTPGAEGLMRDEMARAVIERADIDFIDPDKAAVSNVSPASIINGVAPVASTGGNSAAEVRADIRNLFASWISGNVNPANAVFIMSPGTALALSLMYNDLDSARVFPGIGMNGGTLEGIPVIVSQYAVNDGGSAGSLVILANASDIFLSEDAGVDIAVSREASIQMNDAPDNPATASTVFTSMFQTNQLAIRSELFINWAKRRTNAVAWLDSVSWGT